MRQFWPTSKIKDIKRERERDREKVIEQGGREGCVREKRDLTRAAR